MLQSFFHRAQPAVSAKGAILAGLGGAIAIGLLGLLTTWGPVPLLMAPFGASCVLLFSAPAAPLSQPANVVGGHAVAALVGLGLRFLSPDVWWAAAMAVGIAIALMAVLRVTHPPAGANPLVIFAADPELAFLIAPVVPGAIILVAVATLYHRLITGIAYPLQK